MKAKVIAFYLPQFHPVKENDEMWGKGFTEWTNVAKAKPLFKGHYQPQIPADLGFYDLRLSETREAQAEMAKEYGVYGFCYWHYWFGNGKEILERPFDEVLKSGKPDFPFCLGWANHSWSNKTWQKSKNFTKDVVFLEQTYPGEEDYKNHFFRVLPAFKDDRYITIDGKPVFLVFDPASIPDTELFISLWNKLAVENGLPGVYFIARVPGYYPEDVLNHNENTIENNFNRFLRMGYNAINADMQRYSETQVAGKLGKLNNYIKKKLFGNSLKIYDYGKIIENSFTRELNADNIFPQIIPRLDRTPRSGKDSRIYKNSSPEKFSKCIDFALKCVEAREEQKKVIFLQAWNEWGEGNYMEPDLLFGHEYLESLRKKIK